MRGRYYPSEDKRECLFSILHDCKILVKEWKTGEIIHSDIFGRIHESKLNNHLHEMTTSYYASKIMDWVKENAFTHRVLVAMEGRN